MVLTRFLQGTRQLDLFAEQVLSRSACPTLCDLMNCSPPGSSFHGDSPSKKYWGGLPFPSPGIYRTRDEGKNKSRFEVSLPVLTERREKKALQEKTEGQFKVQLQGRMTWSPWKASRKSLCVLGLISFEPQFLICETDIKILPVFHVCLLSYSVKSNFLQPFGL